MQLDNSQKANQTGSRSLRELLLMAEITAPHGVMGDLKYRLLTDNPEQFFSMTSAYLLDKNENVIRKINFTTKGEGKTSTLHIETIDNRNQAEGLRFHYLAKKRSESEPLPEGRYYICDLIGCEVKLQNGEVLGVLKEILQNTCQDLYVVKRFNKNDLLFPLVDDTLLSVDIDKGEIVVQLPKGLIEIFD